MCADERIHWDKQAVNYASRQMQSHYGRFLDLYEACCWHFIKPVLPPIFSSLILEAGCGTGRWVYYLAPLGYRFILSDISAEMLAHAKKRVAEANLEEQVLSFRQQDICTMGDHPPESYDMVIALGGVLSLCRDAVKAMEEIFRVLKPGGFAICDAANRYRTALDLVRDKEVTQLPDLLREGIFTRPDGLSDYRFSTSELVELFRGSGLLVHKLAGISPFLDYLPTRAQMELLEDDAVYATLLDASLRYAEKPDVVSLSGRLLVVARKPARP